jgi:hypothetical protein
MNNWQPIASAPKDETRVLLAKVGNPSLHTAFWRGGIWNCGGGFYFNSPTHWMPLPNPPSDAGPVHE